MASFLESKKFKKFIAMLYGLGASVVIVGALFKIQHWPGSGIMLTIGLSIEALIFAVSAFEPAHEEVDWSLVYPELAGIEEMEHHDTKKKSLSPTQELDKMLEDAKIGPELLNSVGTGLKNLSDNASKLSDLSDASVATQEYVGNVRSASKSVGELSDTYSKTSEVLQRDINTADQYSASFKSAAQSANQLSETYQLSTQVMKEDLKANEEYLSTVQNATKSAQSLVDNYVMASESLSKSAQAVDLTKVDGSAYASQLQLVSKNLASLNSVYELQLKEATDQVSNTEKFNSNIEQFLNAMQKSADDTKLLNDSVSKLTQNIAALNTVYGNMLGAMTLRA